MELYQSGSIGVTSDFDRIRAEIVYHALKQKTDNISAEVRLLFKFPNSAESVMLAHVEVPVVKGEHRGREKYRIEAAAWGWLERYFDDACFGSDQINIFSGKPCSECADDKPGTSELSPEQEEELQRELEQILRDYAA